MTEYDFFDTFLDVSHVRDAFPHAAVKVADGADAGGAAAVPAHDPDRPAARLPRW